MYSTDRYQQKVTYSTDRYRRMRTLHPSKEVEKALNSPNLSKDPKLWSLYTQKPKKSKGRPSFWETCSNKSLALGALGTPGTCPKGKDSKGILFRIPPKKKPVSKNRPREKVRSECKIGLFSGIGIGDRVAYDAKKGEQVSSVLVYDPII